MGKKPGTNREKKGKMWRGETRRSAFESLSFRGKRGSIWSRRQQRKAKTFGGILRVLTKSGEEKYAIVQGRYTGKWSFPKGHSNPMESAMECTEREILEETGISSLPRPIRFFKLGFGEYYVFEFERELELNPRDTNEIINTRWATVEEMRSMSVNADIVHYLNAM